MRISAFCDFYDEAYRPMQLVIKTQPGELDWSSPLYLSIPAPLEPFHSEDFGDESGASVLLDDLVRVPGKDNYIGILLPQIKARYGMEFTQLIAQMADVEEILRLNVG